MLPKGRFLFQTLASKLESFSGMQSTLTLCKDSHSLPSGSVCVCVYVSIGKHITSSSCWHLSNRGFSLFRKLLLRIGAVSSYWKCSKLPQPNREPVKMGMTARLCGLEEFSFVLFFFRINRSYGCLQLALFH